MEQDEKIINDIRKAALQADIRKRKRYYEMHNKKARERDDIKMGQVVLLRNMKTPKKGELAMKHRQVFYPQPYLVRNRIGKLIVLEGLFDKKIRWADIQFVKQVKGRTDLYSKLPRRIQRQLGKPFKSPDNFKTPADLEDLIEAFKEIDVKSNESSNDESETIESEESIQKELLPSKLSSNIGRISSIPTHNRSLLISEKKKVTEKITKKQHSKIETKQRYKTIISSTESEISKTKHTFKPPSKAKTIIIQPSIKTKEKSSIQFKIKNQINKILTPKFWQDKDIIKIKNKIKPKPK